MSYQPQHFTAPDGTEMVVVRAKDFERLRLLAGDGEDVAVALATEARIAAGEGTVPGEVVKLMIEDGLSPLAAWRRHRGLSQAEVAQRTGLSQVWVGRIETGGGYGTRKTRTALAAALDAPVWAIEDDEADDDGRVARAESDTAEAIAARYGLNPKSYRARLRSANLRWHRKHQGWEVRAGGPEHRDMLEIAEAMQRRG